MPVRQQPVLRNFSNHLFPRIAMEDVQELELPAPLGRAKRTVVGHLVGGRFTLDRVMVRGVGAVTIKALAEKGEMQLMHLPADVRDVRCDIYLAHKLAIECEEVTTQVQFEMHWPNGSRTSIRVS